MIVLGNSSNASATAARSLQLASAALEESLDKLSSGRRIVNTRDDAAGAAVHMKLVAAFNRMNAVESNLLNANSLLQVQSSSLQELSALLSRMSELKVASMDATKSQADLSNYALEYSQLAAQIRKIDERTFNGLRLFSDTSSDSVARVSASEDGTQTLNITVPSMKVSTITDVACDKTYQIVTASMEWSEAEADAVSKGGHLAQFKSSTDWEQAVFQLGSSLTQNPLWIGLKQDAGSLAAATGWKWVTGENLGTARYGVDWDGGQPDNGGAGEAGAAASADALVWNQPASQCSTFGHLGDEDASNSAGDVTGYVIQYLDGTGATQYKAVRGTPLTWDQARLAAYTPAAGVLPANASQALARDFSVANASAVLTLSSTAGLSAGMSIEDGLLIPPGATIVSVDSTTQVTMSTAASTSASVTGGALTITRPQYPHLATLKTGAEYAAAKAQLQNQGVGTNEMLWLGGYQASVGAETDPEADWHWVAAVKAGDSLVNSTTDAALIWSSNNHGDQPDNLPSAAVGENVAYMSGSSGGWFDATQSPNQGGVTVSGYLLQTNTLTAITLDKIAAAEQWVSQYQAQCGAAMSRVQFQLDGVRNAKMNLEAAGSRIADVDVASETSKLNRAQVLMQAGATAMAQSNQSAQLVLRLLA